MNQLIIGNKSKHTISSYRLDITKFLEYLDEMKLKKLLTIKSANLSEYISNLQKQGKAQASIVRAFSSIRSFCSFLVKTKAIPEGFTDLYETPKFKSPAPYVPTIEQMINMLKYVDSSTHSGCRDKAILELLYSSGLRASELCDLQYEDLGDCHIQIKCGKGCKVRSVPITSEADWTIRDYIEKYRGTDDGYLFVTSLGKRISRQYLTQIVQDYAKLSGLKNVTAHTLRHACATHLLEKGADIRMIQDILGHSSIMTTQRYTQLSKHKLQDMFNSFHPRANK